MPILMRTALFVPGNRPDRIEKAFNTEADVIIIDLEDAVPLSQKESSRSNVRKKIATFADRMILVRTNINKLLLEAEKKNSIPEGTISVFPLIESAAAVQHVYDIASTKTKPDRIYTLMFGAADYTLDMGISMTMEGTELLYPRSRISIACRAAGIAAPIDTPFMIDIKNTEALLSDAMRAKELGFQGKLAIHPRQIAPCNQLFSPSPEEIAKSEKIVQAFEEAESAGKGAIQLDGKFIDYPVVKRSKDTLTLAATIAKKK